MSSDGAWAEVVAPVLAALGLVLAAVAWPGVRTTTRLVHLWTARLGVVLAEHPDARRGWAREWEDRRRREGDQRRGAWFFLTVSPGAGVHLKVTAAGVGSGVSLTTTAAAARAPGDRTNA